MFLHFADHCLLCEWYVHVTYCKMIDISLYFLEPSSLPFHVEWTWVPFWFCMNLAIYINKWSLGELPSGAVGRISIPKMYT